eukprot:Gregarina_sp_Poly_1__10523@NODE_774_length_6341_cov_258_715014_g569_i0_p4_GENE_NODE_774_length_6341_cov_258_715014_g569_i0NODE_774_length_6341_cov_258_715014_g569_i0_p4_ORF_typecomplete_len133_score13_60_NODE_774_length_6341_cov_258_715014_g569_i039437
MALQDLTRKGERYAEEVHTEHRQPKRLKMMTFLPMNMVREVSLRLDGRVSEYVDDITQETWETSCFWAEELHCMVQKRRSAKGIHYDMRRVFRDGRVKGQSAPVMLFRWTMVTLAGKVLRADRWLVQVAAGS